MKRGKWETSSSCYFNASCPPEAIFIVERFEGETIFHYAQKCNSLSNEKSLKPVPSTFIYENVFFVFSFLFLWPMSIPESEPLSQYDTLSVTIWLDQIIQASFILIPEIIVVNSLPFICLFFFCWYLLNIKVSDIYILYFIYCILYIVY